MNNLTTAKRSGIKWGPFTMRIPFIHIKFRAPEFLQGLKSYFLLLKQNLNI